MSVYYFSAKTDKNWKDCEQKPREVKNRSEALRFAQRLCRITGLSVRMTSTKGVNNHGHIVEKCD